MICSWCKFSVFLFCTEAAPVYHVQNSNMVSCTWLVGKQMNKSTSKRETRSSTCGRVLSFVQWTQTLAKRRPEFLQQTKEPIKSAQKEDKPKLRNTARQTIVQQRQARYHPTRQVLVYQGKWGGHPTRQAGDATIQQRESVGVASF